MRQVILGIVGVACVLLTGADRLCAVQPTWQPLAANESAQFRGGQICYTYPLPTDCPPSPNPGTTCPGSKCDPNIGCVFMVANTHQASYNSSCQYAAIGSLSCSSIGYFCNIGMMCAFACDVDANGMKICKDDFAAPFMPGQTNFKPFGGSCTTYALKSSVKNSPIAVINGAGFTVFDGPPSNR